MKISNIIFLLSFVFLLAACDDSDKVESDPNVIQRGEAEYVITAQHPNEDNKLSYDFSTMLSGAVLSEPDYSVIWDFGDGSDKQSGVSLNHTYASEGDYSVTAYITDNVNSKFRTTSTIVIAGGEPDIYNAEIVAYREEDRRAYRFVSSAVSSLGEELRYSWNYGDGTPATLPKRENSANHNFRRYGDNYTVRVSIDNGRGGQGSVVEKSITIQTDNPDLFFDCGSDGYAIDSDYVMLGQYIKCQPNLTGGSIPDIQYSWEFYSEITKDNYTDYGGKDNASLIAVEYITTSIDGTSTTIPQILNAADISSSNAGNVKYYELDGLGKSEVTDSVRFMYEDGGAKFVIVKGSSQQFLNSALSTYGEYFLPSNCMLGSLKCDNVTGDATRLNYQCEADAYAVKKDPTDGKITIEPMNGVYKFTAYDNDGKLITTLDNDTNKDNITIQCSTDGKNYTDYPSNASNNSNDGDSNQIKTCKVVLKYYKAEKYDSSTGYTTMELEVSHTEKVDEHEVNAVLKQSRDFRVEAPKLSLTHKQDSADSNSNTTANPLKFTFTVNSDVNLNDSDNITNVKYHWNFGDGTDAVTTSNTTEHIYSSADSQYEVRVYAASDQFDSTVPATSLIRMNPSFSGSYFNVNRKTASASGETQNNEYYKTANIYTINTDYMGKVDNMSVPTKYEFTLQNSNGSYTRTFIVDNVTLNGNTYSLTTAKPTVNNIFDNSSEFAIPYGTPFLLTLKVINKASGHEYILQNTVPVASALPPNNVAHPGWNNTSKTTTYVMREDNLSTTSNDQQIPISDNMCLYDLNPGNINSSLNDKWGLGINSAVKGQTQLKVKCSQSVKAENFSTEKIRGRTKVSVISGPIVLTDGLISESNSIDRYLGASFGK